MLAETAIYPGIWFSDRNGYVKAAATGILTPTRVSGYALLVSPFWHAGSAAALIALQHAIGIALVIALYALLVRRGARAGWPQCASSPPRSTPTWSCRARDHVRDALPRLLGRSAHRPAVERSPLAGGRRRRRPAARLRRGTRSVGIPLVAIVVVYLLVRRVGWRPLLPSPSAALVIAGGYLVLFHHQNGSYAFENTGGRFLYARVAPFADCAKLHGVPADQRSLCPDPNHRLSTNTYLWGRHSPIRGRKDDYRIRNFALRVVEQEPVAYAKVVGRGVCTTSSRGTGSARTTTGSRCGSSRPTRAGATRAIAADPARRPARAQAASDHAQPARRAGWSCGRG